MSLQSNLAEYAAELMVYFEKHKLIEISKRILVECALERPDNVPLWMGKNIKRIAASIYQDCLNQGKDGVIASLHLSANFLYRVVFFGRRGSGRKTQAIYLARRFNLVYSKDMWFYKQNEIAIDEYLSKRHETIYVNGSGNSQAVKNEMFAKLEKTPYIMGCKQDTWDLMNK
uniref:Uncharacterized protein n=1 Tax=Stomoxys calcitrans TaxID=35570 RepID=A0A1I8PWI0_STOCA